MRTAIAPERSGGVRVAQRHERVVHERMLDDVDGHPRTIYGCDRISGGRWDVSAAPMRRRGRRRCRRRKRSPRRFRPRRDRRHRRDDGRGGARSVAWRRWRSTGATSSRRHRGRPSPRAFAARETIDAAGAVVMPGLINTHTHAPMVLYRGLADDLALMEWLQKYIFPAEAKTVSPEFVRAGTRLAALEMIESGTTTSPTCITSRRRSRGRRRRRAARRARPDDHPVPGGRRQDAGRRAGARGARSSRSSRATR